MNMSQTSPKRSSCTGFGDRNMPDPTSPPQPNQAVSILPPSMTKERQVCFDSTGRIPSARVRSFSNLKPQPTTPRSGPHPWTPHPPPENVHPPARNQSWRAGRIAGWNPSNVPSGFSMAAAASPSPSSQACMNESPTAMSCSVTGPSVYVVGPMYAGPVSAGPVSPVSAPPGTAGVSVRSNGPPLVTIQIAATKTAIPTTPAAMRWFRRLRSRRRSSAS